MTDTQNILAEVLLENCKPYSRQNVQAHSRFKRYYVRNKNTPYKDTDEDKEVLLQELRAKFDAVNTLPVITNNTGRHLLYYTVFLNEEYVDLIELSLQSVFDCTPNINFDVLFITDEEHKEKILQKPITNKFNCYFHILSTPFSGPRASMRKLTVFDYNNINLYEKILFLDCDAIAINDINTLFNLVTSPEKLYTGTNKNITTNSLSSPTHGLMFFSEKDLEIVVENYTKFIPFNAGQFVFYNTERMRGHFNNTRWLIKNWPGDLFFEQGPMNYYFVINNISTILKTVSGQSIFAVTYMSKTPDTITVRELMKLKPPMVVTGATTTACLTSISDLIQKESVETLMVYPDKEACIVHFAGSPLGGAKKLEAIKTFLDARKS